MAADYIPPNVPLYLTPEEIPSGVFCRNLKIPDDPVWVGLVDGVLSELFNPAKWREYGALTPEQAAEEWQRFVEQAWAELGCSSDVPTPYWDDTTDLDDQEPAAIQTWYGEVTDPEAPADELTFQENAAVWLITGFIAYAGDIGGAIFFHTIAPRFVLAWNKGDVREIFRVVVDAADAGRVDTDDYDAGDIIEMNVVGDDDLEEHDIYIIRVDE